MNNKNIIVATTLSAILSVAHLTAAQAADGAQTMKPLQGLSFHAGTKHTVAYYLNESICKLVLTSADDANFAPTRSEVAIEPGKSTRYELSNGEEFEFYCQQDAQAMSVKPLETTAKNN